MVGLKHEQFTVRENARSWALNAYMRAGGRTPVLVIARSHNEAEQIANDLITFLGKQEVAIFPAWETLPFERISPTIETMGKRSEILWKLRSQYPPKVIVGTARSVTQILTPRLEVGPIELTHGGSINYDSLLKELAYFGYRRATQVERRGEFAVRGSIIDIFPSTTTYPIRVDTWGDEIDRLTRFSISDQRSMNAEQTIQVFPARTLLATDEVQRKAKQLMKSHPWGRSNWQRFIDRNFFEGMESWLPWVCSGQTTILDLFPKNGVIFLLEPQHTFQRSRDLLMEETNLGSALAKTWGIAATGDFPKLHQDLEQLLINSDQKVIELSSSSPDPEAPDFTSTTFRNPNESQEVRIRELLQEDYCIILTTELESSISALQSQLGSIGISAKNYTTNDDLSLDPGVLITQAVIQNAVVFKEMKLAVCPQAEFYGRRQTRKAPIKRKADQTPLIEDLRQGSFVVHEHHGIARYGGIVQRTLVGNERDYLLLEYRRGDKLYVPTDQIDQVSQFTGGSIPTLSRMGGSDWARKKITIRKEVEKIAQELVALYQQRESSEGFKYSPDTPWQEELEGSFPYQETPDQLSAMEDVKSDMEQVKPMDRLVCGDVGFGKTEIALRAAFKAALDGKQVAILVPTTLLAQQHFQTFTERLSPYPIEVAVLSRFLSQKQATEAIKKIETGEIDLVIGTHRLLSEDVKFRDLGLLVIDEEQRFGVAHKERIKSLKSNVDVLTLTATPIPRTLEMSLTGIRDLTLLGTPPVDRQPILTYVGDYDHEIVTAAIRREQLRDGQVFFVHNQVADIEEVAQRLREKIPQVRVAVAHGQMDEGTLERTVLDFWDKQYDVLVCTTIIESGIDMPSVNTLIVDRADLLGLGQLHQIRGRVGRSGVRAYAYLLTPPGQNLAEDAYERLRTVEEASELGSGFKIAMRDLEIRGAGNLLGTGQSGHIATVGYDLYCKLVVDAVDEIKGIPKEDKPEVLIEIPITAYIPKEYIPREESRLEAYRKLSAVAQRNDIKEIEQDWLDRYGEPPEETVNLLRIAYVKVSCLEHGIAEVQASKAFGFGKTKWNLRISPISLRPSERVRTTRIYEGSIYKEEKKELILSISDIEKASEEILNYLDTVSLKK